MIAEFILFVMLQAKFEDLLEKQGVHLRDGADSLEVTGPGSFQVHQAARAACGGRIDAEFIRTRVQTDLVWTQLFGNDGVTGNIRVKRGHISDVIDSLFKFTHKTRRQADPLHTHPFQFMGKVIVFSMTGWRFRFIN